MCADLIGERRQEPKDDLISVLVSKFDEGELGHEEFTNLEGEPVGRDPMGDDELNLFLTVLLIAFAKATYAQEPTNAYGTTTSYSRDLLHRVSTNTQTAISSTSADGRRAGGG